MKSLGKGRVNSVLCNICGAEDRGVWLRARAFVSLHRVNWPQPPFLGRRAVLERPPVFPAAATPVIA